MAKITTTLFGELAILPFQAEAPVVETLEFLTDVLTSFNGNEQRLQMRTMPRQSFEYTVPLQIWQAAKAFNTEYRAIRKRWAVPVWTQAQYVGEVTAHAATIACNTSLYDLRASSLAFLYAGPDNWQIVEISTKTGSLINVSNNLAYMNGAWLMPARLGWVADKIDKPTSGHAGKSSIKFEIDDNLEITPAAPAQYSGNDIYYDASLLSGDNLARALQSRVDIVDYELGKVVRRSPWTNARYGSPFRSILNGPAEIKTYRDFLYRRAGKFRAFWFPTFESNLRVVDTGSITNFLTIENDNFLDYDIRTNIAIQSTAGVWYPRVISSPVQIAGNRIQLTLSSPLNINAANIARVSYLGLNRFDTDRIELRYIGNGIVESEVTVLEITP